MQLMIVFIADVILTTDSGLSSTDEAIEVNQRVVVDNVLAPYSGNFTGQSRFQRVP